MPQMSPLLWAYLFLTFSILLLFSMIKIYFFSNKKLNIINPSFEKNTFNKLNWMW